MRNTLNSVPYNVEFTRVKKVKKVITKVRHKKRQKNPQVKVAQQKSQLTKSGNVTYNSDTVRYKYTVSIDSSEGIMRQWNRRSWVMTNDG